MDEKVHQFLFKTKHLGFRLLTKEDVHYWVELEADPEVRKFTFFGERTAKQIEERINKIISSYEKKGYPVIL